MREQKCCECEECVMQMARETPSHAMLVPAGANALAIKVYSQILQLIVLIQHML